MSEVKEAMVVYHLPEYGAIHTLVLMVVMVAMGVTLFSKVAFSISFFQLHHTVVSLYHCVAAISKSSLNHVPSKIIGNSGDYGKGYSEAGKWAEHLYVQVHILSSDRNHCRLYHKLFFQRFLLELSFVEQLIENYWVI